MVKVHMGRSCQRTLKRLASFILILLRLVLSSFVVEELEKVTERKFPSKKDAIDRFLTKLSYEMVYTPHRMKGGLFEIRDVKDYPVLYTAIVEDVDVLITGDKDFQKIEIEKPDIMTPKEFIEIHL